jgi:sugar lactone lactonase YvrE
MRLRLVLWCALGCASGLAAPPFADAASAASPITATPPILAIAGTGAACSTPPECGDGAAATTAQLSYPESVAVDAYGDVYVADWGDNEIRRIAPNGTMTMVAGSGTACWAAPSCGDGAAAADAKLSFPQGIAVAADGTLYIADTADNEIRRVSPSGKITRFAGTGAECAQPPSCGDGGPATSAQLGAPAGVAVDVAGNVYIADTGDSEIRKVSRSGTISRVAGTGVFCATAPSCGDGGPAIGAELNFPGGVAIDATGSLFIADGGDNEVRRVSTSGTITRVAGSGKQCASPPACGDGGAATSADLNGDDGVTVASGGTLYIADAGDNEVRRVSAAGKIATVAGNGSACAVATSCGDAGPAFGAELNYPDAVALDPRGNLYIADTYDSELRWVPRAGTATLASPTRRVILSAFTLTLTGTSITVRCALSGPAALILTVTSPARSATVVREVGHAGLDALVWNRRLGRTPAPHGRYTLTVTAAAGGRSTSQKLTVRL